MTSRLTLNLGLRYDVPHLLTRKFTTGKICSNRAGSPVVIPSAPPGLVYPGDPGGSGRT